MFWSLLIFCLHFITAYHSPCYVLLLLIYLALSLFVSVQWGLFYTSCFSNTAHFLHFTVSSCYLWQLHHRERERERQKGDSRKRKMKTKRETERKSQQQRRQKNKRCLARKRQASAPRRKKRTTGLPNCITRSDARWRESSAQSGGRSSELIARRRYRTGLSPETMT